LGRMNVNPTRMELKKLKARLATAKRGHKLLKDKNDELVRRFSVLIRENKRLRDKVEQAVSSSLAQFAIARSFMSKSEVGLNFAMPSTSLELDCSTTTVMNLTVPKLELKENRSANKYPYSFVGVTSEADYSVELLSGALADLVKLAEVEKTCAMLADDIEKSKRRVNALEFVMIPDLEETIKYITMKLEENDRSSRTRLMKVKSMLEAREING